MNESLVLGPRTEVTGQRTKDRPAMKSPIFVFVLSVLAASVASTGNAQTATGSSTASTSSTTTSTSSTTKPRAGTAAITTAPAATSANKVQAQAGTSKPLVKSVPSTGVIGKSLLKGKSKRSIPPPPPIFGYSRGRSSKKSTAMTSSHTPGVDNSGRGDMSGSRVPFYPSSRTVTTQSHQTTATKTPTNRITKPKGQN